MPPILDIPEITPQDLAEKLKSDADLILLDVREPWEIDLAKLEDRRMTVVPLSRLAQENESALPAAMQDDRNAEVVVMCHHGVRSADVTSWLLEQGWKNVRSLAGGIAAWADEVDDSVGRY